MAARNSIGTDGAVSAPTHTTVRAEWRGEQRYDISRDNGPAITIDGNRVAGTGPVDTLLGALAACSSMDVVDYLTKRRTPVDALHIVVDAERRAIAPRRVLSARLAFHLRGESLEATHAARAIDLAIQTYCSVASSLAPDIVIETQLILNDDVYPVKRQQITQVTS
ncbi:MAG: OsmC family protein [bacterium]